MKKLLKSLKILFITLYKYFWKVKVTILPTPCRLCAGATKIRIGYHRIFLECQNCGFIFTGDFPAFIANRGMGLVGSWGGVNAGGEREDFLVRMMQRDLDKSTFLLYGVGSNQSFPILMSEGYNVYGCDISRSVIRYRKNEYGPEFFFHTNKLVNLTHKFDVVVACEVFEHFHNPSQWIELIIRSIKKDGVLCGTTNFYPGGDIEDSQKVGYMSLDGHVAYWSERSMFLLFGNYGMELVAFEMICPGSVKPDLRYNDLFPNKRVFFASADVKTISYLQELKEKSPILPLDTSTYPHPAYSKPTFRS